MVPPVLNVPAGLQHTTSSSGGGHSGLVVERVCDAVGCSIHDASIITTTTNVLVLPSRQLPPGAKLSSPDLADAGACWGSVTSLLMEGLGG